MQTESKKTKEESDFGLNGKDRLPILHISTAIKFEKSNAFLQDMHGVA